MDSKYKNLSKNLEEWEIVIDSILSNIGEKIDMKLMDNIPLYKKIQDKIPLTLSDLLHLKGLYKIVETNLYYEKNKQTFKIKWEEDKKRTHISEIFDKNLKNMDISPNWHFTAYELHVPINFSHITSKPLREFLERINPYYYVEFVLDGEDRLCLKDDYIVHDTKDNGDGYSFRWNLKAYSVDDLQKEDKIDFRDFMEEIRDLNKKKIQHDKQIIEKVENIDKKLKKIEQEKIDAFRERILQNLLIKFPQIIESNLNYISEEYKLGKTNFRGDILFSDSHNIKLNTELKVRVPRFKDFKRQLTNYKKNIPNEERLLYIAPDITPEQINFCNEHNIEFKIIKLDSILRW